MAFVSDNQISSFLSEAGLSLLTVRPGDLTVSTLHAYVCLDSHDLYMHVR